MTSPKQQRPVPYLNRRDQYRMLAMVGLLCLVLVAIKFAARPESWYWILPPEAENGSETARLDELDFRVKQDSDRPLPPDVFRAVAENDDADSGVDPESATEPTNTAGPMPLPSAEIDPQVLADVEDNTVGVRRVEVEAYHLMLERIRRLPNVAVEAQADDDVAFTVIMLQSDDYRGKLVAITGQLRRLTEHPVMPNERGLDQLYEGWVFTADSGNNPWRIVCTQIPSGIMPGELIEPVPIRVVGYFFKRTGYLSQGGQHVAPTLLAKSFQRLPPPPVSVIPEVSTEFRYGVLGFVVLMIATLILLVVRFTMADRAFARSRLSQLAAARLDANPEDLASLEELETLDPATMVEPATSEDRPAN